MKKIIVLQVSLFIMFCSATSYSGQQAVPEQALRHMARGEAAVEMAKSVEDYESAIKEFQEAARLAPDWADVYFNLGVVQEKMGRFDDAIKNLTRYLQLNPNVMDAQEVRKLITKIEYKNEKVNKYQNIIKKLTAPGEWRYISGNTPPMRPRNFRLRDGKLEGRIFQVQMNDWEWIPIAFDGKKLDYSFIWYHCPFNLNGGCPYRVSAKEEIVSTEPLRLKAKVVWSQQFGRRAISEYEFLSEKVDNQ